MVQSLKLSHLFLRLTLAAVFLWFGIDKFIHPHYWIDAWLPARVASLLDGAHFNALNFIYLNAIVEILIGVSLISTLMLRLFAVFGIILLVMAMVFHGFNEILVRDIALIGALLALIVWPDRRYLS